MITKLQANGLKGLEFTHDPEHCCLFTGSNFAGKTARLDAIRLAVCGKLPELGGRTKDTFELAASTRMTVGVTIDGEHHINRTFWTEKGSIKTEVDTDYPEETLASLASCPLFNTSDYFQMTDGERLQFVFARAPLDPTLFTCASVVSRLRAVKLDEQNEQTQQVLDKWVEECQSELANPIDGITALIAKETGTLSVGFTTWNRRAKDSEGAVRILTELKLREKECSAETLAGIESQIDEAEAEAKDASETLGRLRSQKKQAEGMVATRERCRLILNDPTDYGKQLAELQAKLDKLKVVAGEPIEEPSQTVARKLYDTAREAINVVLAIKSKISMAKDEIARIDSMGLCAGCTGKLRSSWDTLLDRHTAELREAEEKEGAATIRYNAANKVYTDALERWHVWVKAQDPIRGIEKQLAVERANASAIMEKREDAKVQLQSLADLVEPSPESIAAATARHMNVSNLLGGLRGKRDEAKRLQHDLARAAQAALEHEIAVANVSVIRALGKALKVIQQEIIDEAFKKMLGVANRVVGGVMKSPLAYFDGQIGRWEGAKFVGHSTMSGTEQALTDIGVAVALSASAPMRVVLMDECGRIDAKNIDLVLANLRKCVEDGIIEQVFAVDVRPLQPEGWEVVRL